MEKSIPELKTKFVCMCVSGKKNSCEIHVIILRYIRNVTELLTKTSFFLYFRDRPKNCKGNRLRRSRKYMRKSN